MKKHICLILILLLVSCGRWKVTKYKSNRLCTFSEGRDIGSIAFDFDDKDLLDITFHLHYNRGILYAVDNILKRIQIMDIDCTPQLVIGSKKTQPSKTYGVRYSFFNFSIIGEIAVDNERNIYIQNRFVSSRKYRRYRKKSNLGFSSSYILVFNEKGSLLYTLGQKGFPDIPFYFIKSMEVDESNRLFVITKSFNTFSVYRFIKKKRDLYLNIGESDFVDKKDEEEYVGKIENILIYQTGENLLLSVAYYKDFEFKYRKIYEYSIKQRRRSKTVLKIQDAKNEIYTIVDDKLIYLWDIEERDMRFIVYNLQGNIVNNIQMQFPEKDGYFEDILIDESGRLFSYHVNKRGIDIFEWW